jgi:hypothetical protein
MAEKVPNQALVSAALQMMEAAGKSLTRVETGTRSMRFVAPDGRTVRVRSCNDHVLVVLADSTEPDARLNIEGTDLLLVVMPQTARTAGPVAAYLIPTSVAVKDVRKSHRDWLKSNPATKGNNRTWNVWFGDGPAACSGFDRRWARYRLLGPSPEVRLSTATHASTLGDVISRARSEIASAAGVPVDAVKISVALD